jgi:cytochrome c biogenesis protein CcdA
MDFINSLIDNNNIPLLTALLIGLLTSISPCPLATNITALAYLSKDIKDSKRTIVNSLVYTLGRALTYTLLVLLITFGLSSFEVARIFQGWGDKVLGPVLIIIGLVMLDVVKINLSKGKATEKIQKWVEGKGYLGSFLLGAFFALAFCPYSGVMFFGMLIPLAASSSLPIFLSLSFSLGTAVPVILFAILLSISVQRMSRVFNKVKDIEVVIRKVIGVVFVLVGVYYLQYLVNYIVMLFN